MCKYNALSRTKEQECIFVNPCFRHLEFMQAMIDWAQRDSRNVEYPVGGSIFQVEYHASDKTKGI